MFAFTSPSGITFVDSSKLQVCYNLGILRHQVFKCTSKRGKKRWGGSTETKVISLVHWAGTYR
uniref:transposase n=1 Tax=Candidatus Enterovibrio escicola TaxID=1927127 RepID=UPI003742B7BA